MSWIEVETTTVSKPEVIGLAAQLGISRAHALGLLVVWWSWCDSNMVDGVTRYVTRDAIDDLVAHVGFAAALETVGWVTFSGSDVSIPRFDRHHGNSAKKRRQAAERQRRHRDRVTQLSRSERDRSVTTEQNITEQLKVSLAGASEPDPEPEFAPTPEPIDWLTAEADFDGFWRSCPNTIKPTARGIPHELRADFQARWCDPAWREMLPKAFGLLGRRRPWHGQLVTLRAFLAPQFVVEFVAQAEDEERGNTRRKRGSGSSRNHLEVGGHEPNGGFDGVATSAVANRG